MILQHLNSFLLTLLVNLSFLIHNLHLQQFSNLTKISLYFSSNIKIIKLKFINQNKMGINRDSRHKKRHTGGVMPIHQKKKAYEKGRPMASTKIGEKRIKKIRVRGGNYKFRALRLNQGNFVWQSETAVFKTKIISVAFHPSDPEFVRTNTVVKSSIVKIDAIPFKSFLIKKYFGLKTDKEVSEFNFNLESWNTARGQDDSKLKLRQANP